MFCILDENLCRFSSHKRVNNSSFVRHFKHIGSLKVLSSLEKLSLGDNNGDTGFGGKKGIEGTDVKNSEDDLFGSIKILKYPS